MATSFSSQPFPDTVEDAPIIVRGKIGMIYTNWAYGADGTKRIYTFNELVVEDVLKGNGITGATVVVRELGGEKDGVGMKISGAARFQKNEEVVLLLSDPNRDGSYDIRGMMMGKYNIERDEDGQEYIVGLGVMEMMPYEDGHDRHNHGEHEGHNASKRWTIDSLRELIKKQSRGVYKEQKNIKAQPSPSLTPSEVAVSSVPVPVNTPTQQAAPQLQNNESDRASSPWLYILSGIGVVAGAGILIATRKR